MWASTIPGKDVAFPIGTEACDSLLYERGGGKVKGYHAGVRYPKDLW